MGLDSQEVHASCEATARTCAASRRGAPDAAWTRREARGALQGRQRRGTSPALRRAWCLQLGAARLTELGEGRSRVARMAARLTGLQKT